MTLLWVLAAAGLAHAQDPGEPQEVPIVHSIVVEGLDVQSESAVIALLGQRLGEPFVFSAIEPGIRDLWRTYRIIVMSVTPRPVEGGVELVVRVLEQPVDFEPRFVGNSTIKESKLREWAGMDDRAELYLHEAARVRERLIRAYKSKGYYFVEIDIVTSGDDPDSPDDAGPPDVIIEIREGPKVRSTEVSIKGNDSLRHTGWGFWSGGLASLAKVQTKGRGLIRWWGAVFTAEELAADLIAMRDVYRDRGWRDAMVEVDHLEFSEDRRRVKVHIVVDEGQQYTVGEVQVWAFERGRDGADKEPVRTELFFPEEELVEKLAMRPGEPFERARFVRDRQALREFYGERGYLEKSRFANPEEADGWEFLEPDILEDFEKKQITVIYRIHQGRQRFIGEVRFAGNEHTRDTVLRRQVRVMPGDKADVKEIDRALGRIAGTGYFSDERDPAHRPPIYVFRETDDPDKVDVEFMVTEGRNVDLNLSGGVASDSGLVGLLSLSMRNFDIGDPPDSFWGSLGEIYRKEAFHGDGELLNIDLSPGSQVDFWRIRYRHPDIFGTHFDSWSFNTELSRRERRFRSHDEGNTSISFDLGRQFGQDFSVSAGPVYQNVHLSHYDNGGVPTTLDPDSARKSDFVGLNVDMRYDQLDNRFSPRKGYQLRWQNSVYGGPLGGDNDLLKSEVFLDWYHQFGTDEDDAHPGTYVALAGGIADSLGNPDEVNYSQRFFLGGSSSLRGFQYRGVGPDGKDKDGEQTTYPIGGETYLRGTFEYRFPLYTVAQPGTARRREMFRGLLFLDWGLTDEDTYALAIDQLRASAGFGFGLTQPIPLTFNFGFPIQSDSGDDKEIFSFRLSLR